MPARLPEGVRPTLDAARESLFNSLSHAVEWDALQVCDLFAGSGALGIEALSRGVGHVCFVEKNRCVLTCIQQNLDSLAVDASKYSLELGDALDFVQNTRRRFDLMFIDPPYALHAINPLLHAILERGLLTEEALLVAEHGPSEHLLVDARLRVKSRKHYGETCVEILQLSADEV